MKRVTRPRFAGIMERAKAKHRQAKLAAEQALKQQQELDDSANDNLSGRQLVEAAALARLRAREEKLD